MTEQSEGNNYTSEINFFLLKGHKVYFIASAWEKNPLFDPQVEKNRMQHEKNIYFPVLHTTFIPLGGQKRICLPRWGHKSTLFDPLVQIVYCANLFW